MKEELERIERDLKAIEGRLDALKKTREMLIRVKEEKIYRRFKILQEIEKDKEEGD